MEKNKISTNKMYIKSIVDVLTTTIINNKKEIEVKIQNISDKRIF